MVLSELEEILRSRKGTLTHEEENVLESCKEKAVGKFLNSAIIGSTIGWTVTRGLSNFLRFNISGGVAAISGLLSLDRSINSCLDHILSLEGSRMQMELANLIVMKFQHDPRRMHLISKHFYLEKVYDDSTSDQPKLRWRYRHFYGDSVAYAQWTHDHDSHSDSCKDSEDTVQNESHNGPETGKADFVSNQVPVNNGIDLIADPLDSVFGYMMTVEEIQHPDSSTMPTRIHGRSHKRSHRRRRMRHHEVPMGPEHT